MDMNKKYYFVVGPRSTGRATAEAFWENPIEQAGGKVEPADEKFFEPIVKQYISEYLKRRREERK